MADTTTRREEMAKQGALITERHELQAVIPAARREEFGVEPRGFFDVSDSTTWEARQGGQQWDSVAKSGGRREPMLIAYRSMVTKLESLDTEAAAEQAGGDMSKGGILTFAFGTDTSDGQDVNSANFEEVFARADFQPGGRTYIAKALEQAAEEFDEEFGDKPKSDQPVKLDLIVTDGELDDMDVASKFIEDAGPKHVILVCVFGYDEPGGGDRHSKALLQWGKTAQRLKDSDKFGHQYLFVVPFDDTTNPDDVARDAAIAVS